MRDEPPNRAEVAPYKVLRFDEGQIPAGLLRAHNLKAGVRGELRVLRGSVVFVEENGSRTPLQSGESLSIAAEVVHHLEEAAEAAIEISLYQV